MCAPSEGPVKGEDDETTILTNNIDGTKVGGQVCTHSLLLCFLLGLGFLGTFDELELLLHATGLHFHLI